MNRRWKDILWVATFVGLAVYSITWWVLYFRNPDMTTQRIIITYWRWLIVPLLWIVAMWGVYHLSRVKAVQLIWDRLVFWFAYLQGCVSSPLRFIANRWHQWIGRNSR